MKRQEMMMTQFHSLESMPYNTRTLTNLYPYLNNPLFCFLEEWLVKRPRTPGGSLPVESPYVVPLVL